MNHLSLYLNTLLYLKPEQIWFRVLFRIRRPKPDLRPAPPLRSGTALKTPPAAMPVSFLGDGRFRFLNEEYSIDPANGWNCPELKKLWLYNLHYFDWLRQPGLSETDGDKTIRDWIAANSPGRGNGWEPYTLSLRIVNWIKWHLSGHRLTPEALHSLAVQIRFLNQRLERHLLANHYLANAKALVFGGLFFEGVEAGKWLKTGKEIFDRELPEQILSDGGHFELSPMYHSVILEDLLDLYNVSAPISVETLTEKMFSWLSSMTGPDGKISLFNDAAFGIAVPPEALHGYAERLKLSHPEKSESDLPTSGYARIEAGNWTLIIDAGPVGPAYQPGHAHADTLSFELYHRNFRLFSNSGTGCYADSEMRRQQRGTAAHNTLQLDGRNSSQVWGAHRVAARAEIIERYWERPNVFRAAHNGYRSVIHRRTFHAEPECITVSDVLEGTGPRNVEIFLHLHPDCMVTADGNVCTIRSPEGTFLLTAPSGLTPEICRGTLSREFGLFAENPVLRFSGNIELPGKFEVVLSELNEMERK